MKRLLSLISVFVLFFILVSCSRQVTQDTPEDALFLMQTAIDNQDYEAFQKYLLESKRQVYTKEDLASLEEMGATGGGGDTSYFLREYPNGQLVLFELTLRKVDGKYYIQDIIPVPEQAKDLFTGRKGK